jgi:hypothetical protein
VRNLPYLSFAYEHLYISSSGIIYQREFDNIHVSCHLSGFCQDADWGTTNTLPDEIMANAKQKQFSRYFESFQFPTALVHFSSARAGTPQDTQLYKKTLPHQTFYLYSDHQLINIYRTIKHMPMLGKIVHYTADAVLISAVLAGIKRSTGLQ